MKTNMQSIDAGRKVLSNSIEAIRISYFFPNSVPLSVPIVFPGYSYTTQTKLNYQAKNESIHWMEAV